MAERSPSDLPSELDSRIAAFERAWLSNGGAPISDFLPPENNPQYLDVLCEAIRCDLELRWSRRTPRRLDEYRSDFPIAFRDQRRVRELAYEEYRQRLQAGESVSSDEYREQYGIDTSDWPTPESLAPLTEVVGVGGGTSDGEKTDELYRVLGGEAPEAAATIDDARASMPKIGDRFLGFDLIGGLGHGAFGRVFLARQLELANRLVALKVSADLGGESQRLAQLQHTNIVPVYSTHRVGRLQAVCMPYCGSVTLADVLTDMSKSKAHLPDTGQALLKTLFDSRCRPPLPKNGTPGAVEGPSPSPVTPQMLSRLSHVDAVLWLFARLADGLAHAHERGILHRDLKPANILLTDDGQPMLLDFNLAADIKPSSGWVARVGGTLPYMAPECLAACRGGKPNVDARSDLYALGIMLYKLLTGKAPFPSPMGPTTAIVELMLAQRQKQPIPPRRINRAISPAVNAVVRKLLEPDPNRRYASAADLREDLERQLTHRPLAHAPDTSPLERMKKWRRRNPKLFAALAATIAVTVLLVMPAGALAVRQNQLAERHLRYEQADAVLRQQQAIESAQMAQILLSTQTGNRALLDEGFIKAHEALAVYSMGVDSTWTEQRAMQILSAAQQSELRTEIGETLLLMARGDLLRGNLDAALHWNRLAESCFPPNERPRWLYRQRLELDPSTADNSVLGTAEHTDRDAYHEGLELAAQTKYGAALAKLLPFTEKHPRHFMSWYVRGICHDGVGRLTDSTAAFTVCVSLRPDFHWSYFSRGLARLQQKRFDLAESDFTRAMDLKPNWTSALINRAIAREGSRDWAGAEQDLTDALSRDDAPRRIYFLRAKIRLAKGDKAGAATDEAEGLKQMPTDALSWNTRGLWRMDSKPEEALKDFDEALELNPRSRDALQNKAVLLADNLNRPKEAIAVMDRLLDMYPDYVEARAGRAVYLARLGMADRAREDAEACLLVEPTPYRYYQFASMYAQLAGHEPNGRWRSQVIRYLALAFRNGFADFALVDKDSDLEPLRKDEELRRIVAHARALYFKK